MGCLGGSGLNVNNGNGNAGSSSGPKLLVIVSPPGAGKDDIMRAEEKQRKGQFVKVVSHTTRAKLEDETEGVDYYFVSVDEFNKMESNGEFIEVSENNGDKYGLSKQELEAKQRLPQIPYCTLDLTGADAIKRANIQANFLSILPSDENTISNRIKEKYNNITASLQDQKAKGQQQTEELKKKLEEQSKQNSEEMQKKLDKAKEDVNNIKSSTLFNLQVIGNDIKKLTTDFDSQLKECYPEQLN